MPDSKSAAFVCVGGLTLGTIFLLRKRRTRVWKGKLTYQGPDVPRSLQTTGEVYLERDTTGGDKPPVGTQFRPTDVTVTNARPGKPTLDNEGFTLVDHKWAHTDYHDMKRVVTEYYPEVCELVKRATGAEKVIAFDHNIRTRNKNQDAKDTSLQGPITIAHGDYTQKSAPGRIKDLSKPLTVNDTMRLVLGEGEALLDEAEAAARLKKRFAIINVWRNIADTPIQKTPLACCVADSVSQDDLIVLEVRYVDRTGENYLVHGNKDTKHKWQFFPEMKKDEALLLKTWDTEGVAPCHGGGNGSVKATFTLHTAVDMEGDATSTAPERHSIEVRTIAFF